MTKWGYISFCLFVMICVANTSWSQREDKITFNEGVNSYRDGNYANAQSRFEAAYERNHENTRALYNAGNAAYLNGDFEKANQYYSDYAKVAKTPEEIAKAHYNKGNTYLQQADALGMNPEKFQDAQKLYKQAVTSFKNSLKNNPSDQDAKYNLTYALDKIQQIQNQQNQDQNQENKSGQGEGEKPESKNQDQSSEGQEGDENENSDNQNDNGNEGENQDKKGNEGENDDSGEKGDEQENENEGENGDQEEEQNGNEQEGQSGNNPEEQEGSEEQTQIGRAQAEQDLDAINEEEGKILKKVYGSRGNKSKTISSGKDW